MKLFDFQLERGRAGPRVDACPLLVLPCRRSIALTGFGINAFVEGFASLVIVWRFTGSRLHSDKAEARAHRLVAIQFFILAPYVAYEAISKLWHGDQPDTSWIGIALVTTSAIGMPRLGRVNA